MAVATLVPPSSQPRAWIALWLAFLGPLLAADRSAAIQDAVPTSRIAAVEWPSAGMVDPAPPHSTKVAAVIATLRLPVLIPAGFAKYRSFEVVSSGPYDYTASVRHRDAKLWINGTRQEILPPPGALATTDYEGPPPGAFVEPDPPGPVLVNRRVERYGAGYTISAECLSASSARCSDAYLDRLVASLRLFGGKP